MTLTFQKLGTEFRLLGVMRAKVPGGWLVMAITTPEDGVGSEGVGLTFYPDPEHKWGGNSLPSG